MQENVSAKEIANYLSVSHNTAIRKLAALVKKNKIKKQSVFRHGSTRKDTDKIKAIAAKAASTTASH